jgi:hypothetical protein
MCNPADDCDVLAIKGEKKQGGQKKEDNHLIERRKCSCSSQLSVVVSNNKENAPFKKEGLATGLRLIRNYSLDLFCRGRKGLSERKEVSSHV